LFEHGDIPARRDVGLSATVEIFEQERAAHADARGLDSPALLRLLPFVPRPFPHFGS